MKEEKPQEALRVELLGGFRVSVGARTVGQDVWRLKKAKSLLKLLALAPANRMHREQVMDLLWPDSPDPKSQANNLRQALHAARRALEPAPAPGTASDRHYLRLVEDQVVLCPEGAVWVDAQAFEEAVTTARRVREPAAYRAAVDLYAGELLPEERYEEWAQQRREGLRAAYLSLLLELAGLYEEREEFEGAIEALRKAVVAEPTHEEAHLGLMRLYSLTGRRQEALLQYERLRKALLEELGVEEPGEAGRHLYEEIRAGRSPTARTPAGEDRASPGAPVGPARHNLPVERTSFVGREEEMVEVGRLLSMTRLLTLTGAGGSGKTRFALTLARNLAGTYEDGTWLVELAPLSEPELVERTVAATLGVREQPGHPLTDMLKEHLSSKKLLLVLDNCEHLIEAAARLAETLLDFCPNVKILATSREALNVSGELVWQVPSLSVPQEAEATSPEVEELAGYESVRLFVERARYRRPSFELTPENALTVAEVCGRLEGMPLAIELAAARVGVLEVGQISARLKDSLKVLAGSNRTAEPRQRTLREALEWSYELLGELERDLFRRLSVFSGGFTLEAAEAVGAEPESGIEGEDVLDLLGRLVDKSLVVAHEQDGEARYRMLEPIRQYGREKLRGSAEVVRRRHAEHYLALAEETDQKEQGARLWRLGTEHDNFRAALRWALGPETSAESAELGLRLAVALGQQGFWAAYAPSEGREWLERGLARSGASPRSIRARALYEASWLATVQGDYGETVAWLRETLDTFKELGEVSRAADSLTLLGQMMLQGGDRERIDPLCEEAEELRRELTDERAAARLLIFLALAAWDEGDYRRTVELAEQSLALSRTLGDLYAIALCSGSLGFAVLDKGETDRAEALFAEGLRALRELQDKEGIFYCLLGMAGVAGSRGQPARVAWLGGAAEALGEAFAIGILPMYRRNYDNDTRIATARSQLNDEAWTAAWAEGRAMTPEQAVEYALSAEEKPPTKASTPEVSPAGGKQQPVTLTPREREVVVLIARELTNRRIAQELVISERTVATHVHKILQKLGLRSRLQIAAWAMEQGLLR